MIIKYFNNCQQILGATFSVVGLHSGIFAIEIDKTEHDLTSMRAATTATKFQNPNELDRARVVIDMGQMLDI